MADGDENEKRPSRPRTHRRAVPIEVDPEVTPPPVDVTSLGRRHDVTSNPRNMQAAVDHIQDTLLGLTRGLQELWPARHLDRRFEDLSTKVDQVFSLVTALDARTLVHEEQINTFLMPHARAAMAKLDHLTGTLEGCRVKVDRFVDHELPKAIKALDALEDRVHAINTVATTVDKLGETREQMFTQRITALAKHDESVASAVDSMTARLRIIEDQMLTWKSKASMVAAVGGVGGGVSAGIVALLNYLLG